MKSFFLTAAILLSAASAQAVTCNISQFRAGQGNTSVTLTTQGPKTFVVLTNYKPFPNYHAPQQSFEVTVTAHGPELVEYANQEQGFDLEVSYQPMNGKFTGTMIHELDGRRERDSVLCTLN